MYIDRMEDNAFHYNDLHSQALTEDPEAYSNEIYNHGSPFLDHYSFILN